LSAVARNGLPDLGDLSVPVTSDLFLSWSFRGQWPKDALAATHGATFVRLVDKALEDYGQARRALDTYLTNPQRLSVLIASVSHLESCVHSMRRSFRHLVALKNTELSTRLPRLDRKVVEAAETEFVEVRNLLEHLDEAMSKGELVSGEAHALLYTADGHAAEIGPYQLRFADLASTLRRLHALAMAVANGGPGSAAT